MQVEDWKLKQYGKFHFYWYLQLRNNIYENVILVDFIS